jgi:hypothetical protein
VKKGHLIGFAITLLLGFNALGQGKKYIQLHDEFYDEKPVHFGFMFGLTSSNYYANGVPSVLVNSVTGEPLALTSPKTFGFQIGGIVNYALSKHVELKSGLNIALYDRQIQFANEDLISRESTWLEIPLLVKFRSVRRQNHRMYLISGLKLGLEANVKKKNTAVTANTSELSFEYGIGFERFYRFFKFSPEIRISHGLNNLFVPPGTANSYSKLSQLNSHTISLIFNFE